MKEAITISILLLILIVVQYIEQRKIVISISRTLFSKVIAIALSIAILVLFWQREPESQLKLISFSILIFSTSFLKEGLGNTNIIKLGLFDISYSKFEYIVVEQAKNNKSFVTFYKKNNNTVSLLVNEEAEITRKFLLNTTNKSIPVSIEYSKKA